MDKEAILQQFQFFRDAEAPVRTEIMQAGSYAHVPEGTRVFGEGDRCEQLALVGGGLVRVFKTSESGREVTLYHVQSGEGCVVNMLSVFTGEKSLAAAVTESPVDVVLYPASAFRQWLAKSASVRHFVFEMMAVRVVHILTLLEEITFRKMDQRLADFLDRRFADEHTHIVTMTHEEIATELGSAREVISRLLKELERHGAIELSRGQIKLRNRQALRK